MELLNNTPPALLFIIGALALMALPATARKAGAIALAIISFFALSQMSDGNRVSFEFLGFDDLTVLPVLAAAIFVFRSNATMTARDAEAVKEVFTDGAELRVAGVGDHDCEFRSILFVERRVALGP